MRSADSVASLLQELQQGRTAALSQLVPRLYDELRLLARRERRPWRARRSPGTTSLLHETYLKLASAEEQVAWESRAQFFYLAARAMRSILVDDARHRGREKRGGDRRQVELDSSALVVAHRSEEILAIDEALERLAATDHRAVEVVECRFFGGLTVEETAEALALSTATVKRTWTLARTWLYRELGRAAAMPAAP